MKSSLHLFTLLLLFSSCGAPPKDDYALYGEAQGTTYSIKYWGDNLANYQYGIDSLLRELDSSLSTYMPGSIISRVNEQDSAAVDDFFVTVFTRSIEINELTEGAFDPSVMPLVQAWGFGPNKAPEIDTSKVDSLRALVGLSQFGISSSTWLNSQNEKVAINYLIKAKKEIQLDFNAIAQGYSVDVLTAYLDSKQVNNYLVEVGGEVRAKGENAKENWWLIGIDKPEDHVKRRPLQAKLALQNTAMATSGSYRKFYELNGTKYSHTIDPATGYPVKHALLSVTVLAEDCMSADAYATAFMVMGLKKSRLFLSQHPDLGLEAYFIYSNEEGKRLTQATAGLSELLEEDL